MKIMKAAAVVVSFYVAFFERNRPLFTTIFTERRRSEAANYIYEPICKPQYLQTLAAIEVCICKVIVNIKLGELTFKEQLKT